MKKVSDSERMRQYNQITREIEDTDNMILDAFEEEDRLTYEDDEETEDDYTISISLKDTIKPYVPEHSAVPQVDQRKSSHPVLVSVFAIVSMICTFYTLYSDITHHVFHGLIFLIAIICAIVAIVLGFKK